MSRAIYWVDFLLVHATSIVKREAAFMVRVVCDHPGAARELARLWAEATARDGEAPTLLESDAKHAQALANRIATVGATAIVAVDDGAIVAGCFIEQLVDARHSPIANCGHLSGLAVDPSRWGEGLATRVLTGAEEAALDQSYRSLRLHVLEANDRARRFYEYCGWALNAAGLPHRAGPQAEYEKGLLAETAAP